MKLEISKEKIAGALPALGKLICRTSPVKAFHGVALEFGVHHLTLRTNSIEEALILSLQTESEEQLKIVLDFDSFRTAIRGCRSKMLEVEADCEKFLLDGKEIEIVREEFPEVPCGSETVTVKLPENFTELLASAAPLVNRENYRRILRGINLSRDGITATNGRELLNIPVELEMESLTIPFPLALIAAKSHEPGTLTKWLNRDQLYFEVNTGSWRWIAKTLAGTYPNWKSIVPEKKSLTHSLEFTSETAERMKSFLKSIPDDPPYTGITLIRKDASHLLLQGKERKEEFQAGFSADWREYSLTISRTILQRLLSEGHTKIEASDQHAPFMATGGTGIYTAMPLYQTTQKTASKEAEKENSSMKTENETPASAGSAATAASATAPEANPLEELTTSIDAFKLKLKAITEESNILSRKVREYAISQKQKERDFYLAKRAIERIRMAI